MRIIFLIKSKLAQEKAFNFFFSSIFTLSKTDYEKKILMMLKAYKKHTIIYYILIY